MSMPKGIRSTLVTHITLFYDYPDLLTMYGILGGNNGMDYNSVPKLLL